MAFKATHRFARIAPRKARLVMDLIRGRNVNDALAMLQFSKKRAAVLIDKVVRSAVANASDNGRRKRSTPHDDDRRDEPRHVADGRDPATRRDA